MPKEVLIDKAYYWVCWGGHWKVAQWVDGGWRLTSQAQARHISCAAQARCATHRRANAMTGREALRAYADGKTCRRKVGRGDWDEIGEYMVDSVLEFDDWELVPGQPATDEELIAEMERIGGTSTDSAIRGAYDYCARMLRERKVTP